MAFHRSAKWAAVDFEAWHGCFSSYLFSFPLHVLFGSQTRKLSESSSCFGHRTVVGVLCKFNRPNGLLTGGRSVCLCCLRALSLCFFSCNAFHATWLCDQRLLSPISKGAHGVCLCIFQLVLQAFAPATVFFWTNCYAPVPLLGVFQVFLCKISHTTVTVCSKWHHVQNWTNFILKNVIPF